MLKSVNIPLSRCSLGVGISYFWSLVLIDKESKGVLGSQQCNSFFWSYGFGHFQFCSSGFLFIRSFLWIRSSDPAQYKNDLYLQIFKKIRFLCQIKKSTTKWGVTVFSFCQCAVHTQEYTYIQQPFLKGILKCSRTCHVGCNSPKKDKQHNQSF